MDQTPQDRDPEKAPAEVAAAMPVLNPNRRALLRGGAAAAPVLLTLVSRPVSAGTTCVVASSFVSVATFHSRNPNATSVQCTTRTCQDWYNQACLSPSGNPSRPSYLNNSVASLLGSAGSMYDQAALWFVLQNFPYGITTSGQM